LSIDPGFVKSELGKSQANAFLRFIIHGIEYMFAKSAEKGASTTITCATLTSDKLNPGMHYVDNKEGPVTDIAADPELAEQLWRISMECCGVQQN
jgi:hypothetical protein